VWEEYRRAIRATGLDIELMPLNRSDFYKAVETPDHVLTIQTGDQQRYANILVSIGVRTEDPILPG
jgi:L-fucose mutarotase